MDAKLKKLLEQAAMEHDPSRFEGQRLIVVDEDARAEVETDRYGQTSLDFEVAMRVECWADTVHLTVSISSDGEVNVDETAIGGHHLDDKFPSPMPFDWPNELAERE